MLWLLNDFLLQADGSVKMGWNLTDNLLFTIVLPSDETVAAVTDAQLASLGLGGPAAFLVAFENLHRRVGNAGWSEVQPGVFVATVHDSFAASCIAIAEIIARAPVEGRTAFFVPNRSHLVVTNAEDERAMAAALDYSADLHFKAEQSLTVQPLVREGGGFTRFAVQTTLNERLSRSLKIELSLSYNAQAAKYQRAGGPVFQQIFITEPAGKGARSTVPWPFGFETFLPKADWIFFKRGDEPAFEVPWDAAAAILGLCEVPGMLPARYHVTGLVSVEQFTALSRAAAFSN